MMPRVIHFEINADDPKRAVEFYETVFGWKINKWEGPAEYWLINTGDEKEPGINGAIMERMDKATTINTVEVPSVDEYVKKIVKTGGKQVEQKECDSGHRLFRVLRRHRGKHLRNNAAKPESQVTMNCTV
jgi:hypothetical protein